MKLKDIAEFKPISTELRRIIKRKLIVLSIKFFNTGGY